jgi:hypothetical protein
MQVSSWTRRGAVLVVCLLATVAVGVAPAAARSRSVCRHAARSTGRHAGARGSRRRAETRCTRRRSTTRHASRRAAARTKSTRALGGGAAVLGSGRSSTLAGDPTSVGSANLFGSGSSLQKVAQLGSSAQNWAGLTATWRTTPADEAWRNGAGPGPTGSFALSSAPATATYDSSSSGSGLAEFGDAGTLAGTVDLAEDPNADGQNPPELDGFIGSDDPPTSGDLASANAASGGVNEVTVPVFQAPIALALSLPNGIVVGAGGKVNLTNTLVQEVYNGTVPQATNGTTTYPAESWGALLTLAGLKLVLASPTATQFTDAGTASGSCTVSTAGTAGGNNCIELEVRNGGSGTTYSVQGFLSISGDTGYNGFSDNESLWPSAIATDGCPSAGGTGSCASDTYAHGYNVGNATGNTGSSQLVKNVLADPGTIGYINLADAAVDVSGDAFTNEVQTTTYPGGGSASASHQYLFAGVQDNFVGNPNAKATYADPGSVNTVVENSTPVIAVNPNVYTGNNINESGAYSFSQTNVGDWKVAQTGNGQSLGGSVPSDPDTAGHGGGSTYPIIAATYDAAWQNYSGGSLPSTGFYDSGANATAVGDSVISYLAYLTKKGQADLLAARIGYASLPLAIDDLAIAAWESINP